MSGYAGARSLDPYAYIRDVLERLPTQPARRIHELCLTNGPDHVVPLAPQAIEVLLALKLLTGTSRYVFPALTSNVRCMSENTVRSALRRMGYGNDEMTAHGFRAMARTLIAERLEVRAEVIEAQLAHAVPDALGRTQFLEQRREMMMRWADYLDSLRASSDRVA